MDQLLQGVKLTVYCLNDIAISGRSLEEHLEILEQVSSARVYNSMVSG